jgi:hypothetical protein
MWLKLFDIIIWGISNGDLEEIWYVWVHGIWVQSIGC